MQHSHEMLDRPGGFSRVNLLAPLRHRDFRLLWAGMTISLVGDGIFLVAMAWQAYELWNAPAALSADRDRHDDPDDRLPPAGRDPQRSTRPPLADAIRRHRPRARHRRARGPVAHGPPHLLGARRHRRALRRRHCVLHACLRGDRPRHRPRHRSRSRQLARPVRPADRAASRGSCSGGRARGRGSARVVRSPSTPRPSSLLPSPSS